MTPIEPVSLGISLLAIIAFIAPLLYHSNQQKRQGTIYRQQFFQAAQAEGLYLHQFDFWRGPYAIGLDKTKQMIMYASSASPMHLIQIPISEIKEASIIKSSHFAGVGREKAEVIDRLEIQVIFRNPGNTDIRLCFFDGENHSDLLGEGPLAKRWMQIINAQLTSPKT